MHSTQSATGFPLTVPLKADAAHRQPVEIRRAHFGVGIEVRPVRIPDIVEAEVIAKGEQDQPR